MVLSAGDGEADLLAKWMIVAAVGTLGACSAVAPPYGRFVLRVNNNNYRTDRSTMHFFACLLHMFCTVKEVEKGPLQRAVELCCHVLSFLAS